MPGVVFTVEELAVVVKGVLEQKGPISLEDLQLEVLKAIRLPDKMTAALRLLDEIGLLQETGGPIWPQFSLRQK